MFGDCTDFAKFFTLKGGITTINKKDTTQKTFTKLNLKKEKKKKERKLQRICQLQVAQMLLSVTYDQAQET